MNPSEAGRFWDNRADEDAMYFVDNRLEYGNPDTERFWADGLEDLDKLLQALSAELEPTDEVVEIGCGIGRLTRGLAARASSVRALDVSARMIEGAKRHNPSLDNVEWLVGDGESLAGIESDSADAVVSHVVFQHIPDARITLGYVREIGRVLRAGGWTAFHISNDPGVHRPRSRAARVRSALGGLLGRNRDWQVDPHWLGSHVEIPDLRATADEAGMDVERLVGEGTQYCGVLLRARPTAAPPG
jgi:SAM-dependent methyltransferase